MMLKLVAFKSKNFRNICAGLLILLLFGSTCIWIKRVSAQTNVPTIVSLTLINADTGYPIAGYDNLPDNTTLNLATLPTQNLNVRANTSPAIVGSVRFGWDGNPNYRTENTPPYALAGDSQGIYYAWTPSIGTHTLTATAYSGPNATGVAGASVSRQINVIFDQGTSDGVGQGIISGELKKWHRVTISFDGQSTGELASVNPFLDYRLDVTFTSPSGSIWKIPGHYAADGNAAETASSSGSKWRAYFTPNEEGAWSYKASFRTGSNINVSSDPYAGTPTSFDGARGSFTVGPTDKAGRDFRGKGLLRYVGGHHLQFEGSGESFLKGGTDSPENFLAYYEFDATPAKHYFTPHAGDWQSGDPTWQGGKGKNIAGALNYLSGKGMNSVYFLTMNVGGDGNDVWPWTSSSERYRFDVSKLDQWEIVFSHMDKLGIMLHVITQETENELLLDGGELGLQRKLYYKELISRFGHHPALMWNLGEENGTDPSGIGNTDQQRKDFSSYIRGLDIYQHPIVVHTYPGYTDTIYSPLLGWASFEGPSLQLYSVNDTHAETLKWIDQSAQYGRKWIVSLDEIGPADMGVLPDAVDYEHNAVRKQGLWGNLMAEGAGVEWYFGYNYANNDLTCEDWRSRDHMWELTSRALEFFRQYLPFAEMRHADEMTSRTDDYCLAKLGEIYAVYLPNGGATELDLGSSTATYTVDWYNPRTGGTLQKGTIDTVSGSGYKNIGNAPFDDDAVALIRLSHNDVSLPGSQLFFDDFENGTATKWMSVSGAWQVHRSSGNSMEYWNLGADDSLSLAGDASWSNYYVQSYLNMSSEGGGACVLGRVQDASHYYQLELRKDNSGLKEWYIWKNDGGSWAQVAGGRFSYAAGSYYLLRLEMVGSNLTAQVSTDYGQTFQTLGGGTDSRYSQGRIGVRSWGITTSFDQIQVVSR